MAAAWSGLVQLGRRRRAGRQRDTDLREELFLPGRHTEAQQPHRLLGSVGEGVRCVGRDVDGLTGAHDRLFAAGSGFDLAFEKGEGLLKNHAGGAAVHRRAGCACRLGIGDRRCRRPRAGSCRCLRRARCGAGSSRCWGVRSRGSVWGRRPGSARVSFESKGGVERRHKHSFTRNFYLEPCSWA
jgi:hypothetical protein